MKTAVEWLVEESMKLVLQFMKGTLNEDTMDGVIYEIVTKAKEMEKNQSYTYDEMRTIAYNAYCLAQLGEPTEGKYNLWIQQFKKKQDK
jgi:hypothetical protein